MPTKFYSTKSSLKAAIKRQGLHLIKHDLHENGLGHFAHFIVHDEVDARGICHRGFQATVDPERAI